MAFTWVYPKSKGDYILKDVLYEIRENTDYLDDNAVTCLTNNSVIHHPYCTTEQLSQYTVINTTLCSSNYGGQYAPFCSGQSGPGP